MLNFEHNKFVLKFKSVYICLNKKKDMIHNLKILPPYLKSVEDGSKTFELRRDDRDYNVGDTLYLREFTCGEYTGKSCTRTVTYILRDAEQFGLKDGFVILGIK